MKPTWHCSTALGGDVTAARHPKGSPKFRGFQQGAGARLQPIVSPFKPTCQCGVGLIHHAGRSAHFGAECPLRCRADGSWVENHLRHIDPLIDRSSGLPFSLYVVLDTALSVERLPENVQNRPSNRIHVDDCLCALDQHIWDYDVGTIRLT